MEHTQDLISKTTHGGIFTYELRRKGEIIDIWDLGNRVPTLALDYINDSSIGNQTAIAAWYIMLFSNAYTPQADDAYTHIGTRFTEVTTVYDEATRPVYTLNGVSAAGLISNSSSRATFTFNAPGTINGACMVSNSTKGDNGAGPVMLAASAHSPARSVIALDELLVKYEFQGSSS